MIKISFFCNELKMKIMRIEKNWFREKQEIKKQQHKQLTTKSQKRYTYLE